MIKRLKTLSSVALMLLVSGVVFGAFARISGVVSDAGGPLEDVKVILAEFEGGAVDSVQTDSDGAYGFAADLDNGDYVIKALKETYVPYTSGKISLSGDMTATQNVTLAAVTVSGVILGAAEDDDGDDEPVEGVKVVLLGLAVSDTTVTNDSGAYTFTRVKPGTYTVIVPATAEFEAAAESDIAVTDSSVAVPSITLDRILEPSLKITVNNISYGDTITVLGDCKNCEGNAVAIFYSGTLFLEDSVYEHTTTKPTLPGNYKAMASVNIGEVLLVDTVEFRINQKALPWSVGTVQNKVYDGTAAATIVTPPGVLIAGHLIGTDDVGISTSTPGTVAFDSVNVGTGIPVTAADWSAVLTGKDRWKYTVQSAPLFESANITKANQSNVTRERLVQSTDEVRDYSFSLTAMLPNIGARTFGAPTFNIAGSPEDNDGIFSTAPSVSGDTLKFSIVEDASITSNAAISLNVTSGNFNNFLINVNISVVEGASVVIAADVTNRAYNGEPFVIADEDITITNPSDNNSVVTGVTLNALYMSVTVDDDGDEIIDTLGGAPKNVGVYRVTIFVPESNVQYAGSETFDFTIEKKNVTFTVTSITLDVGSEAPEIDDFEVTVDGFVGNEEDDELIKWPKVTISEDVDMDVPGEYPVTLDSAEVGSNYSIVYVNGALIVKDTLNVAVAETARDISETVVKEVSAVSPVKIIASEFVAGPNPVGRAVGAVNFFRVGQRIESGVLTVHSASGAVVARINVNDKSNGTDRRQVASWNLKDARGRTVSEGSYLVRGTVKTVDGRSEKVSMIIGVR